MPGSVLRISCAALHLARMAAPIEGKKKRLFPAKPRGHINLIRIGGEEHDCALFKLKERGARVPVGFKLVNGMLPGSALGSRVFLSSITASGTPLIESTIPTVLLS